MTLEPAECLEEIVEVFKHRDMPQIAHVPSWLPKPRAASNVLSIALIQLHIRGVKIV